MLNKLIGKIKFFNKEKGYGYIIGYDEVQYYFELDNIKCNIDDIRKGIDVLFIPNDLREIYYADDIELINKE